MRYEISDQHQQYQYFLDVEDFKEFKHVKFSMKYEGARYPDAIQSKIEFFLSPSEWNRLVDTLTTIK
jgi:hypothetical protein